MLSSVKKEEGGGGGPATRGRANGAAEAGPTQSGREGWHSGFWPWEVRFPNLSAAPCSLPSITPHPTFMLDELTQQLSSLLTSGYTPRNGVFTDSRHHILDSSSDPAICSGVLQPHLRLRDPIRYLIILWFALLGAP